MISISTKVWIFILSTCLAFLVIGYQLCGRLGLIIGFFLAVLLNFLVFYYGENRVLKKLGAQRWKGQDPWNLNETVAQLSEKIGIPTPAIYVIPNMSASAFCVGHSWRNGSLGFTEGLLRKFTPEEVKAIIAHQLCHIRRLDTFAFSVSSILANSIVGMGQLLDSFLPSRFRFFQNLLSPLGWIIIKGVVGQSSFYENDMMASQLIDNHRLLGEVLWRLEGLAQTQPLAIPPCTSHLFIVDPEGFSQKNIFLRSHPAMRSRLQKLMGYYPL